MDRGAARYDGYADWYDQTFGEVFEPSTWGELIRRMLGTPDAEGDVCLDVGCGTGYHAPVVSAAGYTPVGLDLSADQLRIASGRLSSVVRGDAANLPFANESVTRVLCLFTHTDVDDFAAVVQEAARVLRVGGRLAYIGVHPCFVGTFADRRQEVPAQALVLDRGYGNARVRLDRSGRFNVRGRVGGSNLSLADFLRPFQTVPGLALRSFDELDTDGRPWKTASQDARVVPWNVALTAERQ